MTFAATLTQDVPRAARRVETTRLLTEAASASGEQREQLIEQIVLLNTGVARAIARRYAGRGIPLDDLEQVAYVALLRVARKFDGDKAEDFLTYAVPSIRGEVKRHFRDHGWTIRPTRRVQELQGPVFRVRDSLQETNGKPPTAGQIASRLGVEESEVLEALTAQGCLQPASLDFRVGANSNDPNGFTLGDMLPDLEDGLPAAEARAMLVPALAALSERERLIVQLRFVEDRTQSEIGEVIGVTQMQVSRLLSKILRKLRAVLAEMPPASGSAAPVVPVDMPGAA